MHYVSFYIASGPAYISGNVVTIHGAGTVVVAAVQAGNASYSAAPRVTWSITVNQAGQTITFAPPASPVGYGLVPIRLAATASSGLAVTFSVSSGPATVSGNLLTVNGLGAVLVAANQPGNSNYLPAEPVTQSITVNQGTQTVAFTQPSSPVNYGVGPITLAATGGASGNPVIFNVVTGSATIQGNQLTITGAGPVEVAANQAGNADFMDAAPVTKSITVNPATQTITFAQPPSPVTYGVAPIALSATASSGLPVTFYVASGPAYISGNILTIHGAGTVVVAAIQAGNTNYSAATRITWSITVNQ
jgi:hypothetical protein